VTLTGARAEALRAAGLDPAYVEEVVRRALDEDLGDGLDVTSVATVPFDAEGTGDFVVRGEGVVAGLPVVVAVLEIASDDSVLVTQHVQDGDPVRPGQVLLSATALTRALHLEKEIDVRRHVRTQQPRRLQLPPVQIWRSNRPSPTKGASICKHTGIVK